MSYYYEMRIGELEDEISRKNVMIKKLRTMLDGNQDKVHYLEKDNWFLKDKLCVENGSRGRCEKCGTVSVISLGRNKELK